MAKAIKKLSFNAFTSGVLDSLSWYDISADKEFEIVDCPSLPNPVGCDLSNLDGQHFLAQAQVLAALCLSGRFAADLETLTSLAFQTSQVMSRELTANGSRLLRMWAQRLNYALQPLICAAEPPADLKGLIHETVLQGSKPWDAVQRDGELVWITSDLMNLHILKGDVRTDLTLDLPTQIDTLQDGSLSIGSLYSPVCTILHHDGSQSRLFNDVPVLIVFEWAGSRYMLDKNGRVTDCATRTVIHRATCPQVHFARYFDGILYLLDNGDFGHITLLRMVDGQSLRQSTLPVQVCNDIVVTLYGIYLIDKQQGHIFAFGTDWRYRERRLSFGTGHGQLADPVSLRRSPFGLSCISWLTGKHTEHELF